MPYIPRILEQHLTRYFADTKPPYRCVLIKGARQCGKSTMLERMFPKTRHTHINLLHESGFCHELDNTQKFEDMVFLLEKYFGFHPHPDRVLILDEAQASTRLGHYVRFFKETWKTQRVILTGSTLSELFDDHDNPVGRVDEFVLRPFNFIEFLTALNKSTLVEKLSAWRPDEPFSDTVHQECLNLAGQYLKVGGLPEVVLVYCSDGDYLRHLQNTFAYYKRDFANKTGDKLNSIFEQCFQRIAVATGSSVTLASIIKSSSPGYKKLPDILSLLESWHLLLKLPVETGKMSRVGTITPKRYVFDHGIRFLQNPARFSDINLMDAHDPRRDELGGLIESFVLTEYLSTSPIIEPRTYSRTEQSGSVDFMLQHNNRLMGLEVKCAQKLNQKHLTTLEEFKNDFPGSEIILCNLDKGGYYKSFKGRDVVNIPAYAVYAYLSG